jgi:hypothetical protein
MHCKINNNTSHDLGELEGLVNKFLPFAQKRIGFNRPPTINFLSDEENSRNPLGRTAHYDPSNMEVSIFVDGRHIKDILRSLSHELVHHNQNCRGDFDREFSTEPGYAQNDEFLRKMEEEAYLEGNLCFRDWEDGIKTENKVLYETIYKDAYIVGEKNMSINDWKNKELNNLLMEKWGYKAPINEGISMDEVDYQTGQLTLGENDEEEEEEDDEKSLNVDNIHQDPQSAESRLAEIKKKQILK